MEKRGLISRARESRDRRMVLARLTPAGLKLVDRLDEAGSENAPQTVGPPGEGAAPGPAGAFVCRPGQGRVSFF